MDKKKQALQIDPERMRRVLAMAEARQPPRKMPALKPPSLAQMTALLAREAAEPTTPAPQQQPSAAAASWPPPPGAQVPTDPHHYGALSHAEAAAEAASATAHDFETQLSSIDEARQRLVSDSLREKAARLVERERLQEASGAPDSDSDADAARQRCEKRQRCNVKLPLCSRETDLDGLPNVETVPRDVKLETTSLTRAAETAIDRPLWLPCRSASTAQLQVRAHEEAELYRLRQNETFEMNAQAALSSDTSAFPFLLQLCNQRSLPDTITTSSQQASVRGVLRMTHDEALRTPRPGERECAQGLECEGRHVPGCAPVTLCEFLPAEAQAEFVRTGQLPRERFLCVMCERAYANYAYFATLPACKTLPMNALLSPTHCFVGENEYDLRDTVFSSSQTFNGLIAPVPVHCVLYYMQERHDGLVYYRQAPLYRKPRGEPASFFVTGPGSLKCRRELESAATVAAGASSADASLSRLSLYRQ